MRALSSCLLVTVTKDTRETGTRRQILEPGRQRCGAQPAAPSVDWNLQMLRGRSDPSSPPRPAAGKSLGAGVCSFGPECSRAYSGSQQNPPGTGTGLLSSGLPRALTPRRSHSCVAGHALAGHLLEGGLPCEPDLRASLRGPGCPLLRARSAGRGQSGPDPGARDLHCARPHHPHTLSLGPRGRGISFSGPELTNEAPSYLTARGQRPRI